MVIFLLLVLVWIPCAVMCGLNAADKGHSELAWMLGGLIFGPLALIAVAGMGDQKMRRYIRLMAESQGVDLSEPKPVGDVAQDIIKKRRDY